MPPGRQGAGAQSLGRLGEGTDLPGGPNNGADIIGGPGAIKDIPVRLGAESDLPREPKEGAYIPSRRFGTKAEVLRRLGRLGANISRGPEARSDVP